jgi:hypothetical protein
MFMLQAAFFLNDVLIRGSFKSASTAHTTLARALAFLALSDSEGVRLASMLAVMVGPKNKGCPGQVKTETARVLLPWREAPPRCDRAPFAPLLCRFFSGFPG